MRPLPDLARPQKNRFCLSASDPHPSGEARTWQQVARGDESSGGLHRLAAAQVPARPTERDHVRVAPLAPQLVLGTQPPASAFSISESRRGYPGLLQGFLGILRVFFGC